MSTTTTLYPVYDSYLSNDGASKDSSSELYVSTSQNNADSRILTAFFQFSLPHNIKYKKIVSAKLQFTARCHLGSAGVKNIINFFITPFSANAQMSGITNSNIDSFGTYGSSVIDTLEYVLSDATAPNYTSTRTVDITNIVKNNIYNDFFTATITAYRCLSDYIVIYSSENSSSKPQLVITYEDVTPTADTPIFPVGVIVNQDDDLTFRWRFNCESATSQASFTLKYKLSTSDTYTTLGTGTTDLFYKVSGGTLPIGVIDWSIVSTDTQGQTSPIAYGQFTVVGKPTAPTITDVTVTNALPTITWNATDQVSRDLQLIKDGNVVDYDVSSVPDTTFTPSKFLSNGVYTFKIRVLNSYGYWSEWTSYNFTLSATAPTAPTIYAEAQRNKVKITIENGTDIVYLYRIYDGETVLIAKCIDSTYIDTEAPIGKTCTYYAVSYNGGIAESNHSNIKLTRKGFVLSAGNEEVEIDESTDQYMPFEESFNDDSIASFYIGRDYQVTDKGEHYTRTITRQFVAGEEQYDKIRKLKRDYTYVLYRDQYGNYMTCTMTEISATKVMFNEEYNVRISFSQCYNQKGIDINA